MAAGAGRPAGNDSTLNTDNTHITPDSDGTTILRYAVRLAFAAVVSGVTWLLVSNYESDASGARRVASPRIAVENNRHNADRAREIIDNGQSWETAARVTGVFPSPLRRSARNAS